MQRQRYSIRLTYSWYPDGLQVILLAGSLGAPHRHHLHCSAGGHLRDPAGGVGGSGGMCGKGGTDRGRCCKGKVANTWIGKVRRRWRVVTPCRRCGEQAAGGEGSGRGQQESSSSASDGINVTVDDGSLLGKQCVSNSRIRCAFTRCCSLAPFSHVLHGVLAMQGGYLPGGWPDIGLSVPEAFHQTSFALSLMLVGGAQAGRAGLGRAGQGMQGRAGRVGHRAGQAGLKLLDKRGRAGQGGTGQAGSAASSVWQVSLSCVAAERN